MRIKSPFHDYYDRVMSLGMDQTMLYVRQMDERRDWWPFPEPILYTGTSFVIGFCGKIYPCVNMRITFDYTRDYEERSVFAYSLSVVDNFIKENHDEEVFDHFCLKRHVRRYRWTWCERREVYERFFAECQQKESAYQSLFEEYKCPIFIAQAGREPRVVFHINTLTLEREPIKPTSKSFWDSDSFTLKKVEFVKVKDPHTAFQEIAMFFGNLAFPNRPIPHVNDEDLCASKGFDKFSFRKDKKKHENSTPKTRDDQERR